jgi:hypothetical protein
VGVGRAFGVLSVGDLQARVQSVPSTRTRTRTTAHAPPHTKERAKGTVISE